MKMNNSLKDRLKCKLDFVKSEAYLCQHRKELGIQDLYKVISSNWTNFKKFIIKHSYFGIDT